MTDSINLILTYVVEVFSLILVLIILSGRREARANFSWVMAVIFFPVIGTLAYLIFGNPRLRNIVEKRMKRYPFLDYKQAGNAEYNGGKMGAIITQVTGMQPVLCRNLRLITDASEKYSLLERDIKNAQKYILMEYYLYRNDKTGRRIADLLVKKAEEGVSVFFMVDGWGSMGLMFSGLMKRLRRAGAQTAVFHSPFGIRTASRVNFRNHRKIAVIDGKCAYTGGMNIGDEYAETSKWSDAHLRLEGDAVNAVACYFAEDWMFARGGDISEMLAEGAEQSSGDQTVHVIPSGPHQTTPMIYDSIFAAINRAEKSIDIITPYLVPNQPIMETLKNTAMQGLRVRIIVPGKNNHPFAAAAGRSYYEELIASGVEIYETKGTMLHAKMILLDGRWVTIGSSNMDARSFKLNFELNLMIYSDKFASDVSEMVERYIEASEKIPYEYVKNRQFFIRVFEGVCRTLSPVL
ncbi:MAG: cardiolipin synthase [Deferribacterales bacterium]